MSSLRSLRSFTMRSLVSCMEGADHMEIPTYDRKSDDYKITRHIVCRTLNLHLSPVGSLPKLSYGNIYESCCLTAFVLSQLQQCVCQKLDSRQVTEQPSPSRSKSATRKRSSTHHEGDQRMELEDNPFADATSSSPTENPFSDDFNDNPFTDEAVGQRRDPEFSRTFQNARSGSEQSNDLFSPVSRSPVSRSKPAADYNPFLD